MPRTIEESLEATKREGHKSAYKIAVETGKSLSEVTHKLEQQVSRGELRREDGDYRQDGWD